MGEHDEQGDTEPPVSWRRSPALRSDVATTRRLWRRPATELLALLRTGSVSIATPDDRLLLGELLDALEQVDQAHLDDLVAELRSKP